MLNGYILLYIVSKYHNPVWFVFDFGLYMLHCFPW